MRLTGRIGRLERPWASGTLPPQGRTLAVRVAIEEGLDPAEVVAQAQEIWMMTTEAGVLRSVEELTRFVAAGSGSQPTELLAAAERRVAAWGG